MKKNIKEFEDKLAARLMSGIIVQITKAIRMSLMSVSDVYLLLIFIPLYFISHVFGSASQICNIMHSLAIDTGFSLVQDKDTGLTIINMLGVYLLGTSFDEDNVSGTAQYMLAMQVTTLLQNNILVEIVIALILYLNLSVLEKYPRLHDTMSLIVMNLVQTWVIQQVPKQTQLPCVIMMLYVIVPFMKYYSKAADAYNFIIMTVTSMLMISGVAYWIQTIIFVMIWMFKNDQVSETLGQLATLRLAQMTFISSLSGMARTDPFFVYSLIFICLQFFKT